MDTGLDEETKLIFTAYCSKTVPWIEDIYYKKFDNNRQEVLGLYDPSTPIIWNGYRMVGQDGIGAALQQLPATKHTIISIDCQPVNSPGFANGAQRFILCSVLGKVCYEMEVTNKFSQVLILRAEGKDLRIVYDCYRWVAPEASK